MKNLFLLLLVAMVATTSYGQLKVFTNGFTYVGDNTGVTSPDEQLHVNGLVKSLGETIEVTNGSATVLVNGTDRSAMLFGAGNNAGFTFDENYDYHVRARARSFLLNRSLSGGPYVYVGDGLTANSAMGYSVASATHRLRVNGSVSATAFVVASDKRLKSNVNDFKLGLDEVMQLNPLTYNYNGGAGIHDTDAVQVGIFAQELQKVAPVLVTEENHYELNEETNEEELVDSYLQINDTGIKYMLINAIKDQQAMIEAQAEKIAQLEDVVNTIGSSEINNKSEVTLSSYDLAELGQNTPNPFNGMTSISYIVPTDATSAQISIYGTSGQLMKTIDVEHVGQGTLDVNASDLPAGTYSYQLVVDNRTVESKKMVLAR